MKIIMIILLLQFSTSIIISSDYNTNQPNIVLIVSDDHGTNDLGCYGNDKIKTPNLDKLAAEGVRFTNAYATSASCTASRSVILSGIYNHANGLYGHMHRFHHFTAYDHIKSLPVLLEELGGYRTARIGKYHLAPEKVYHFQKALPGDPRNPVEMSKNCRDFINDKSSNPFFLYYCTSDPHRGGGVVENNPLKPDRFGNRDSGYVGVGETIFNPDDVDVPDYLPDTPECRAELAQYYQSVARVDLGIGSLFKNLKDSGNWENTIIIYISDNGIAFPGAKTNIYQPGIKLPCIVKNPKRVDKGTVSNAYINWADITPTLLDFAGILDEAKDLLKNDYKVGKDNWDNTVNEYFHGRSFRSVLNGETEEGWDETYASHTFHEITMYYPMRAIITENYKLIWNIAYQLPYPHSSDLWESATWQGLIDSKSNFYVNRKMDSYNFRPQFEMYNLRNDPGETNNLAEDENYVRELNVLKEKIKTFQVRTNDPWIVKWIHE